MENSTKKKQLKLKFLYIISNLITKNVRKNSFFKLIKNFINLFIWNLIYQINKAKSIKRSANKYSLVVAAVVV